MTTEVPVQPTPREETPSLMFATFGVALHFVAMPRNGDVNVGTKPEQPSIEFASFEEDLFSYSYLAGRRTSRPFASRVLPDASPKTVWLSVPAPVVYKSEGAEIELRLRRSVPQDVRRRELAVKASRTRFQSGVSVFHLVFVSAAPPGSESDEYDLDEYDLVQLSKLWQGGEDWEAADELRFAWEGTAKASVADLAHAVFPDLALVDDDDPKRPKAACRVGVGTIQLITGKLSPVLALLRDREPITSHSEQAKGLGGILQGLLDFNQIDEEELTDVFGAHRIDGSGFLGMHKGTLLCVMESDRAYDAVASTIGVSPYLLLPQAVLLHNEALLEDSEKWMKRAPRRDDPVKLETCVNAMRRSLSSYLPNVFHYPQERWLFLKGERSRDLRTRRKQLNEERENLETRWLQKVERRRSFADDIRTALLVWLALLPIYPEVKDSMWLKVVAFGGLFLVAAGSVVLPRRSIIYRTIREHLRRRQRHT